MINNAGAIAAQALLVTSIDERPLYWDVAVCTGDKVKRERLPKVKTRPEVIDHMTRVYQPPTQSDASRCGNPDQVAAVLVKDLYGVQAPIERVESLPPVNMAFGALSSR